METVLVARFFEQIGDHAFDMGHRVQFMVTGHFHFEDETQAGLSQFGQRLDQSGIDADLGAGGEPGLL